jgi:hypothetical protein
MANQEKDSLLIIADISGYTRFMMKNAEALGHAQAVITDLMNAVLKEARLPLKVAKLEGDAVFLFAADRGKGSWPKDLAIIRERLPRLYTAFQRKTAELMLTNECDCGVCDHVDYLKLKFVVHAGKVLFHKVGNFDELAGVEVIVLHRLLKNSVDAKEYFLLTEAACQALGMDAGDPLYRPQEEAYEDVGRIPVRVRTDLDALKFHADAQFKAVYSGRWAKLASLIPKTWILMVTSRRRKYSHLNE